MRHATAAIGEPILSREEIRDGLEEFARLYERRPIRDNAGGMMIGHMCLVWLVLRKIRPAVVIESGVFKGQSTWLIEQACSEAEIVCFEPRIDKIVYRSRRATYFASDFLHFGRDLGERRAFAFFDDHQDALPRIEHCKWLGIKEMIFDDNYPPGKGDCYSLKQMSFGAGFDARHRIASFQRNDLFTRLVRKAFGLARYQPFAPTRDLPIEPNMDDWAIFAKHAECYVELPPLAKADRTKWGEDWSTFPYPTADPILAAEERSDELAQYFDQSWAYGWPCYVRLR